MSGRVVVLTGGVGGAKLVRGLTHVIAASSVTAIVNTGDDFRHMGLRVSPDIDTILYTLSGRAHPEQGWGRAEESWSFMSALRSLGGEDWFSLGDGDLALHVLRTARLAAGENLSAITADFARAWDIGAHVLPMSDRPVATEVMTDVGLLPFQNYFVQLRCQPVVRQIQFAGAADAVPAKGVVEALTASNTSAIFIAPSNPYLSIDPILAVPGIRQALADASAPVVAISPIVGGQAVKGPTAKIMSELGIAVSPGSVAAHYAGVIDGMLIDIRDSADGVDVPARQCDTLMLSLADKARVAAEALALAEEIAG